MLKTLLSIEDVANELQVNTVDVLRLIALNRLAASQQPGKDGRQISRILRADFEAFVKKGLKDIHLELVEGFVAGRDHQVERLVDGMIVADANERTTDAAIIRLVLNAEKQGARSGVRSVTIEVDSISDSVKADLSGPKTNFGKPVEGPSLLERYILSRLIRSLAGLTRVAHHGPDTALESLYSSPENYKAIMGRARMKVRSELVSKSLERKVTIRGEESEYGGTVSRIDRELTVWVSYRFGTDLLYPESKVASMIATKFGVSAKASLQGAKKPIDIPSSFAGNLEAQPSQRMQLRKLGTAKK